MCAGETSKLRQVTASALAPSSFVVSETHWVVVQFTTTSAIPSGGGVIVSVPSALEVLPCDAESVLPSAATHHKRA